MKRSYNRSENGLKMWPLHKSTSSSLFFLASFKESVYPEKVQELAAYWGLRQKIFKTMSRNTILSSQKKKNSAILQTCPIWQSFGSSLEGHHHFRSSLNENLVLNFLGIVGKARTKIKALRQVRTYLLRLDLPPLKRFVTWITG